MNDYYYSDLIYVKKSNTHGYGVFTKAFIPADTEIEKPRYAVVPREFKENIIYNEDEKEYLKKTSAIDVSNYIGTFYPIIQNKQYNISAIFIGSISFANWAEEGKENVKCLYDIHSEFIIIKSIKDIQEGEEILLKKVLGPRTNIV